MHPAGGDRTEGDASGYCRGDRLLVRAAIADLAEATVTPAVRLTGSGHPTGHQTAEGSVNPLHRKAA
jgi:hypothetical protein